MIFSRKPLDCTNLKQYEYSESCRFKVTFLAQKRGEDTCYYQSFESVGKTAIGAYLDAANQFKAYSKDTKNLGISEMFYLSTVSDWVTELERWSRD